ncbi:uncharacterized protein LOC143265926 [Megachile rotundata]|uniref:uncharacterized protein LOC143265926 n=1 Tax=Megachile rotundata TaxID=143995 RepID=UPI003FCF88A7
MNAGNPCNKEKITTEEDAKNPELKLAESTTAVRNLQSTTALAAQRMAEIETYDMAKHKWSTWLQRLEGAFAAFEITTETKQRSYLLQYIGIDTYTKLGNAMDGANPYITPLNTIKKCLKTILEPEPLEAAEIFVFQQRKQREDESIQEFVNDLHKLSAKCNFGSYLKTAIRTQLIAGFRNPIIQARLLETQNLTFDTTVNTAITMELAEGSKRSFEFIKTKETEVNSIYTGTVEQAILNLLRKYDITNDRVEPIKSYVAKFTLKDNAKPIFIKHRTVLFKMQQKIKIELDRLVSKEILIPVKSSEWATPIVPSLRKGGTVRICGDYSVP